MCYESLLEKFFDSHDYWLGSGKRQYMSCVFYHNEDQKSAALSILSKRAMKRRVVTLIEPATDFYEVCVLSDQVSDSENLMLYKQLQEREVAHRSAVSAHRSAEDRIILLEADLLTMRRDVDDAQKQLKLLRDR